MGYMISVPIRGLFNLTRIYISYNLISLCIMISVPIRGLFNLTLSLK